MAIQRGGEAVSKGDNVSSTWSIATQYFASGVAIDDTSREIGAVKNPWAYVRATTELPFDKKADPDDAVLRRPDGTGRVRRDRPRTFRCQKASSRKAT